MRPAAGHKKEQCCSVECRVVSSATHLRLGVVGGAGGAAAIVEPVREEIV